jgi:sugar-specific transcriptional regulator TrmB
MPHKLLREIGLSESETKVYLALLELGPSTKGPIVSKSKVASSKVYELLDKLIDKGLVSHIVKSGIKNFQASAPERLLEYVGDREKALQKQKKALERIIPDLYRRRRRAGRTTEVQVFDGMAGAETSFGDILRELKAGDEYYVVGISKFTPLFQRFVVRFHRKRAKAGIRCRILVNDLARHIGRELEDLPLTQVRYLSKELFTPVVFILYKDKTLISIGLEEVFIQVRSQNLTAGMLAYAGHMWKLGVPA